MSFSTYPEYKDSGVEWLGEVPVDWAVSPLKRFLARNDGGVWGDDPDGENETVVLRSTEQAVDGRWQIEEPATRTLNSRERDSALLQVGDLVVTKSSGSSLHIGKTSLVDEAVANLGACYSNFMQRLRVSSDCNPRFVWFVMNNPLARGQFDLLSNSTTGLANLNATILGEVRLAFPSTDEQRQIVNFLDRETAKIDAAVSAQERLIALLAEKRAATISHAVTKGLDPDAPMKDSGIEWLGQIPAHWEFDKLQYFCEFDSGKAHEPFFDEEGEIICATARFVSTGGKPNRFCTQNITPAMPGDILMVMSDLPNGRALARAYLVTNEDSEIAVNQRVARIRPTKGNSAYLAAQLNRHEELLRYNDGMNQTHLPNDAYRKLRLLFPPVEEQNAIAEYVSQQKLRFDRLSAVADAAIQLLKERRAALISAAVTGKIDVRGEVEVEEQEAA